MSLDLTLLVHSQSMYLDLKSTYRNNMVGSCLGFRAMILPRLVHFAASWLKLCLCRRS